MSRGGEGCSVARGVKEGMGVAARMQFGGGKFCCKVGVFHSGNGGVAARTQFGTGTPPLQAGQHSGELTANSD